MPEQKSLYGLMAEFASPQALLDAVRRCRQQGYRDLEAYSPFSIDGLPAALGFHRNRVPLVTLRARPARASSATRDNVSNYPYMGGNPRGGDERTTSHRLCCRRR